MSSKNESKETSMGDIERENIDFNPEEKHFAIVNERGDHNSNDAASNIRAMTEALLTEESGRKDSAITKSSEERNPDSETDKTDLDSSNKRKRTESPDSEIVVIDDNGERGWYIIIFISEAENSLKLYVFLEYLEYALESLLKEQIFRRCLQKR